MELIASPNPNKEKREVYFNLISDGKEPIKIKAIQDGEDEINSIQWDKTFYKNSLIMRFTATWCGSCPKMAASIKTAMNEYPDRIIPLSIYTSDSADGLNCESEEIPDYYGINSYPSAILDGRVNIGNYSQSVAKTLIIRAAKESQTINNNTIHFDGAIYFKEKGDYNYCIFITENGVKAKQTNGGANYIHNSILRKNINNCDIIVYTYSFTEENKTNIPNLKATSVNTYVDNAILVHIGENKNLQYEN